MVRFGACGFTVPALMFKLSLNLALAKALASCSFKKVSVALYLCLPGVRRATDSNETYQMPLLEVLGRMPSIAGTLLRRRDHGAREIAATPCSTTIAQVRQGQ
jgi:hypothetical protein